MRVISAEKSTKLWVSHNRTSLVKNEDIADKNRQWTTLRGGGNLDRNPEQSRGGDQREGFHECSPAKVERRRKKCLPKEGRGEQGVVDWEKEHCSSPEEVLGGEASMGSFSRNRGTKIVCRDSRRLGGRIMSIKGWTGQRIGAACGKHRSSAFGPFGLTDDRGKVKGA